jgi:Polyketide cyclase / dehydrase and lipid transport
MTDASPHDVLAVLADVEAYPLWSDIHESVTVVDRHPSGQPHHVSAVVKVLGIRGRQSLEFHWGSDWMNWDATESTRERAGHAEYTLVRELDRTRVRLDLTVEPTTPLPEFLLRRGADKVMAALTEGLRKRVSSP